MVLGITIRGLPPHKHQPGHASRADHQQQRQRDLRAHRDLHNARHVVQCVKLNPEDLGRIQVKEPLAKTHFIQKSQKADKSHRQNRRASGTGKVADGNWRQTSGDQKGQSRENLNRAVLNKVRVHHVGKQQLQDCKSDRKPVNLY